MKELNDLWSKCEDCGDEFIVQCLSEEINFCPHCGSDNISRDEPDLDYSEDE